MTQDICLVLNRSIQSSIIDGLISLVTRNTLSIKNIY